MGFTIQTGVSAATVFLQGILSFFSPCVLPLVPLYLGYFAGGAEEAGKENGSGKKRRVRLFFRVLFFALGISGAFFILGLGATAAGTFFREQRLLFARAGGILVILFGLYQLGVFGKSRVLGQEHRLPVHIERMTMSPVTAFLMGFLFSFAWTPCVGPALTGVLLMAGSAETGGKGFFLIGVYTAGFVIPFLAAGIFTTRLLQLFRSHIHVVRYTVRAGGVLMILMGLFLFTGKMNDITGYLSGTNGEISAQQNGNGETEEVTEEVEEEGTETADDENREEKDSGTERSAAYEFRLKDQYGKEHCLSDYRGKVIFLNFWGTWCPPCRNEMPDIQKLYEEYEAMGDEADVVILGVAAPGMGQEGTEQDITSFLEENGYTYPVLMDTEWEMFSWYGISSFPTTFMIDKEGNIYGYVSGQLTEDIMRSIIRQTKEDSVSRQ